jgi:hypothetical protein
LFWLFCGLLLLGLILTVKKDQDRVQSKIRESLLQKSNANLQATANPLISSLTPDDIRPSVGFSRINFSGSLTFEGTYARFSDDNINSIFILDSKHNGDLINAIPIQTTSEFQQHLNAKNQTISHPPEATLGETKLN